MYFLLKESAASVTTIVSVSLIVISQSQHRNICTLARQSQLSLATSSHQCGSYISDIAHLPMHPEYKPDTTDWETADSVSKGANP